MKLKYYFKHKTFITNIIVFLVIFYLLIYSKVLVSSISVSCNIFLNNLLPALFPYLFITEILINSGKVKNLSYGMANTISRIFKIPKNTTACVVIGFLLGYPNSAKYIAKLYNNKEIDTNIATKLISFTSNANMSYVIATIGLTMFKSFEIGLILLISHFLSAILIGIFFTPSYNNNIIQQTTTISNSFEKIYSPFELLYISIYGTLKTLAFIFAYTVIFSIIPLLIFNVPIHDTLKAIITGIFEISNGIKCLSALNISLNFKLVLISFVLSFSSLMILTQIFSFAHKAKIKFKSLLKYKLMQGVLSSIITYLILFLYTPVAPVFLSLDSYFYNAPAPSSISYAITLTICFVICFICIKKRQD